MLLQTTACLLAMALQGSHIVHNDLIQIATTSHKALRPSLASVPNPSAFLQTESPVRIKSLKIWVKAFIPRDFEALTLAVMTGDQAGKTAISGPPGDGNHLYLTDQRAFSSEVSAPARMHCLFSIDPLRSESVSVSAECGPTVQVDKATGTYESRTASSSRIKVNDLSVSSTDTGLATISFKMKGAANNPFFEVPGGVSLSPDIDWNLNVVATVSQGGQIATVKVDGKIEPFPATEMYVSVNEGPAQPLFQKGPLPGTDPLNLPLDANRDVTGNVTAQCILDGAWTVTDASKRFRLDITGNAYVLTERAAAGQTLSVPVSVKFDRKGITISRPNTDAVLRFLDISQANINAARARSPINDSFIVLDGSSDVLKGSWSGVLLTTKPNGTLDQVFQPGQKPPKVYVFAK